MDISGEVAKNPYEDWREEPGNYLKNESFAWTKGDHPHHFYVANGKPQQREQKELNIRERKGKDAPKITSAPAESCIQCSLVSGAAASADVDGEKHS